jgi:tripartite-type tricarboxylate transporter receptor subunit TctC
MLARDEVKKTLGNMGATADWGTPQQFSDFVQAETAKFAEIIKREGLQMDAN